MSEKCKSTSPTAIQMKNRRKTISTEEKLEIKSQPERGEQIFFTYAVMFYLLILVYIQFVTMLTE